MFEEVLWPSWANHHYKLKMRIYCQQSKRLNKWLSDWLIGCVGSTHGKYVFLWIYLQLLVIFWYGFIFMEFIIFPTLAIMISGLIQSDIKNHIITSHMVVLQLLYTATGEIWRMAVDLEFVIVAVFLHTVENYTTLARTVKWGNTLLEALGSLSSSNPNKVLPSEVLPSGNVSFIEKKSRYN